MTDRPEKRANVVEAVCARGGELKTEHFKDGRGGRGCIAFVSEAQMAIRKVINETDAMTAEALRAFPDDPDTNYSASALRHAFMRGFQFAKVQERK